MTRAAPVSLLSVLLVAGALAGCAATPAPSTPAATLGASAAGPSAKATAASTASARPAPRPSPTPTPTQAPPATIDPADLPSVAFDPSVTTGWCDPSVAQVVDDAEERIPCGDGLVLGLASLRTLTKEPIGRALLTRPPCAEAACAEAATTSADVQLLAAVGGRSWHVRLTANADGGVSASVPVAGTTVDWPDATGTAPAPARAAIPGAPSAIARRPTLPFCGDSQYGQGAAVRCFLDAVRSGRPAELVDHATGTEGGEVTSLYRFAGNGLVTETMGAEGTWSSTPGYLMAWPDADVFGFEPWSFAGVPVTDRPRETLGTDGSVLAAVPAWWTVPAGALVVPNGEATLTYAVPDDPGTAMAYVNGVVESHGYSAEAREADPGYETAAFTDGTEACSTRVIVRGAPGGSVVTVRFGAACGLRR